MGRNGICGYKKMMKQRRQRNSKGCWCLSVTFIKLLFLISSLENFNCHMSLIGRKTGIKGG
jgi:hypothetical protein